MKKFIFALVAMLSMALVSCNTQFGLAYGVDLQGDGDGNFKVEFPQGSYAMDGTTTLCLQVGDTMLFNDPKLITKDEVLKSGNQKYIKAMERVNESVATEFEAFSGEGTYDIWIKGFVKELGTGLVFSIDRHITNRDQGPNQLRAVNGVEYCPFIK